MTRRRCQALGWSILLLVGITGCGVSGETSPTRLEEIALPEESVPDEARPEDEGPTASVFFVRSERLEAVERSTDPTLDAALRGLLRGPRETEAEGGLRSAIPAGTTLRSASLEAGVATIDLSEGLASVVGPEQVLAIAQLVYTATSVPEAAEVVLSIDGVRISPARGDGSLAGGTVGRSDYPDLFD